MAAFNGAAVTVPALFIAGDRDFLVAAFQQFIARQSTLAPRLQPLGPLHKPLSYAETPPIATRAATSCLRTSK
jgi:hypothetical protein